MIDLDNLRLASREPVIDALADLSGKQAHDWLPDTHPAHSGQFLNTQGRNVTDFRKFSTSFTGRQIAEVLAATSPNHCMDGWVYLSRAFAALLAGDTHTSRHLAYYAQLRAVLCILGYNGIGIFNTLNFVIDDSLRIHRLDQREPTARGLGTHAAAWLVLREWASQPQTSKLFLRSIVFRGVSLSDCIDAIWPSFGTAPLVSSIITTWGVDLMRAADDREHRNISSYSAHAFNPATSDFSSRVELIRDIWYCLEPDGRGGFPTLDRHLLRKFFDLMKTQQDKSTSQRAVWPDGFAKLDPRIREFVPLSFLTRKDEPSDPIAFVCASEKQPGDVHAMLCRALLLLRTATCIVRTTFVDAGFEPLVENLRSWVEPVGVARGFWTDDQQPEEFAELWNVVNDAVLHLDNSLVSSEVEDQFGFLESLSSQALFLSQAERACIWAVCT